MEEEAEENPRDSTVTRVWPDPLTLKTEKRNQEPLKIGALQKQEKVRKWIHSKASRRNQDLP